MTPTEPKRIPRKAKKGRRYIRMYVTEPRWGQIMLSTTYAIAAIIHNSHRRRNTRGCRQYVNIMVRHGLMKRPKPLFRRRAEMVLNDEGFHKLRERIILNPPDEYTDTLRFDGGHIIERVNPRKNEYLE